MEATTRILGDGTVIFQENDPSDFACIIDTGTVEVFRSEGSKTILIATLGPGELLGEMGVIDGMPRSATAQAKGKVAIQEYKAQDFLDRISLDPKFAARIMGVLVSRLRHSTAASGEASSPRTATLPAMPPEATNPTSVPDPGRVEHVGSPPSEETLSPQSAHGPASKPARSAGPQRGNAPKEVTEGLPPSPGRRMAPPASGVPRVLLPPLIGDTDNLHLEALDGWLGSAGSFEITPYPDHRIADPELPEDSRVEMARRAIAEAGAAIAILGRLVPESSPKFIEFSVVTAWPDEEARVSGFSIHDRFYISTLATSAGHLYLHGLIRSAIPGKPEGLMEALEKSIPLDLARARTDGLLNEDTLWPEAAGRQLLSLGNALARIGLLEDGMIGLAMSIETYRAALRTLPVEDSLGRGLAYLHLALCLNAQAERSGDESTRVEACHTVAEAANLFDPTDHRYQYITAQARHGAILYRCALACRDIETCKKGIEAFNRALTQCDKALMQDPWADTMNGLGQVLILLGRLARNTEFLTWAIQVCRNAMEVRSQEHNPLGWARTENNRATALFLLGRAAGNTGTLTDALNGFSDAGKVFETYRAAGLVETAQRNRSMTEEALKQLNEQNGTPEENWWDIK